MLIHPEQIGAYANAERYRGHILRLIEDWESTRPVHPDFEKMTRTEVQAYFQKATESEEAQQHIASGVILELCGRHFHGIVGSDFEKISDFVAALKQLEIEHAQRLYTH